MNGSAALEREGPATVLVVDDDDRLVSSVRRVLAYEGYRVLDRDQRRRRASSWRATSRRT